MLAATRPGPRPPANALTTTAMWKNSKKDALPMNGLTQPVRMPASPLVRTARP